MSKAYDRTAVLRKRIRHVGTAQINDTGRPRDMYYNGRRAPKSDNLVHEYFTTSFCLLYPNADFKRLYDTDRTFKPDAEMQLRNHRYFVELDTGSNRDWQRIERRFRVYERTTDSVLWVCLDAKRMFDLMERCHRDGQFFTTLETIAENPLGELWLDHKHQTYAIE